MKNRRQLLIGAVGLVKGHVRDAGKAMVSICDEFEPYLAKEHFLKGAPFETISIIIQYGTRKEATPEIGKINNRHSELEVAIELPMTEIRRLKHDELQEAFRDATLKTLLAVARKFGLRPQKLDELRKNTQSFLEPQ